MKEGEHESAEKEKEKTRQERKKETSPPFFHLPIFGKRPILQSIASPPLPLLVKILVPKLHGNLIIRKGKQFLPQLVPILSGPLLAQKINDRLGPHEELVTVAPDRVCGVSFSYRFRVSVTMVSGSWASGGFGENYFVFQRFWAILVFLVAVSSVKGGRIPAIVKRRMSVFEGKRALLNLSPDKLHFTKLPLRRTSPWLGETSA